jgi:hypothetical protein
MMAVTYRHIIYIYFPYLAASRIYRNAGPSGQPMVFVQSVNGVDRLVACCALARRYGLVAGLLMPARYAQHYTATVMMPLATVQICNIWLYGRGVIRP